MLKHLIVLRVCVCVCVCVFAFAIVSWRKVNNDSYSVLQIIQSMRSVWGFVNIEQKAEQAQHM